MLEWVGGIFFALYFRFKCFFLIKKLCVCWQRLVSSLKILHLAWLKWKVSNASLSKYVLCTCWGSLGPAQNVAVIREKLQLSSMAHVYLFSLSWAYCVLVVDFLCIWVVQGSLKGKKTPTLQTSQRDFFSSFLIISAFLHHRRSTKKVIKLEVLGQLGNAGNFKEPFLWPLQMGPLLHLLSNFLFQNKTSKLLIMCRAWQQENMRALGHSVHSLLLAVGGGNNPFQKVIKSCHCPKLKVLFLFGAVSW